MKLERREFISLGVAYAIPAFFSKTFAFLPSGNKQLLSIGMSNWSNVKVPDALLKLASEKGHNLLSLHYSLAFDQSIGNSRFILIPFYQKASTVNAISNFMLFEKADQWQYRLQFPSLLFDTLLDYLEEHKHLKLEDVLPKKMNHNNQGPYFETGMGELHYQLSVRSSKNVCELFFKNDKLQKKYVKNFDL